MSRLRQRLRDPAPWLDRRGRPTGGPRRKRRLGLLDLVVVAALVLTAWARTPVGTVVDHAFAQLTGASTAHLPALTAAFHVGPPDAAPALDRIIDAPLEPGLPEGGLPHPWRTAAAALLDPPPPGPLRDRLAARRVAEPDATVLDVLDAHPEPDPVRRLEALLVDGEARERAIGRARAAGQPDPERFAAYRAYLPRRDRARADRSLGRLLAVATALDLRWPVADTFPVTSPFGHRHHPVLKTRRFHNGIDLGTPVGTPLVAAGPGRVRVGRDAVSGLYIVLDHGHGVRTSYCHLSSVAVSPGEVVAAGAVIGRTGNTGRSTGPHLHYVVRVGRRAVDPAHLRRSGPAPGS